MEVKIKDNSEEVLSAVEQAMINALHRIGARAEGFAKKLAPVDTGRLRNNSSNNSTAFSALCG